MKLKWLLFILSFLFSYHILACDEAAFKNCIKYKGGIKCYEKHKCSQNQFQQEFCENFDYRHCLKWKGGIKCLAKQQQCQEILSSSRNNFEGYIPLITTIPGFGESQINCEPSGIIRVNNVRTTDTFVQRFIKAAHQFGQGVKTYKLGNYQAHKTDCSGFLMQAMRKMGLKVSGPQFDLAPNYPRHFKKCDPNNLKPGDLLLLNKSGRQPDHWIMVSSKGKWPSGDIEIMDVSSDYYAGKTYYRGKLNKRRNIQARKVFRCVRHKDMDRQQTNIVSI
jgi:hypothetical protein